MKSPKQGQTAPLISVIMPLYNVGGYLPEAIDSVIAQTLGFEKNIELILVDDGSTDNTDGICEQYAQRYPDNIRYIKQANKGVSAARNKGLKLARGRYINFLDADDIWSKDAFKSSIAFLEKHGHLVDFVASKIKFFEGSIDSHQSNYKFKKTRVIDLKKEPDNPIFHIITCIFKREALAGRSFDERLPLTEDARLLSQILQDKKAYGVLRRPTYYYRKRSGQDSAIAAQTKSKAYYEAAIKLAYLPMMDEWRGSDGKTAEFMQHQILSDLYWRLGQTSQSVLTDKEEAAYKKLIHELIKELDDNVILTRHKLDLEYKIYLLKVKYGQNYLSHISVRGKNYYFDKMYLCTARELTAHLEFIKDKGSGQYVIEGRISPAVVDTIGKIELSAGDNYPAVHTERKQQERRFLGEVISDGGAFTADVGIKDSAHLRVQTVSPDGIRTSLKLHMGQFSGLSSLNYSYTRKPAHLIRRQSRKLVFYKRTHLRAVYFELIYLLRILTHFNIKSAKEQFNKLRQRNLHFLSFKAKVFELSKPALHVVETVLLIPRAILLRALYFSARPLLRHPIWLISDRVMAAGDNGEALFRYIGKQGKVPAKVYFVLSKKSSDYKRMKKYGKVLHQDSLSCKLLFLLSDLVISSHADIETTNPFIRQIDHYVDLFNFKFIFLQHGIIKDDVSDWLNRFDKNISLFITSNKQEYESLFKYPYYYTKDQVLLSGLPRYDFLESNPKGELIVAPTYRADLLKAGTDKYGARPYDSGFKRSGFFRFYNRLINDKAIKDALAGQGITGVFYLHPNFSAQTDDFKTNDIFSVPSFPYDYKKIFEEGNVLLSDYSSTIFDFAYLKKPVIYTHFDIDEFFDGHAYSRGDFFVPERDGFGPVCKDYKTTVQAVTDVIKNGPVMEDKYKKRAAMFFEYNDRNNSRRVYEAIRRISTI